MSKLRNIHIEVGNSLLTVVPAVHYRVPFAESVNNIVCDLGTRPDAIAVELGPSVTVALKTWLEELGISPNRRTTLPYLLGLVVRQRYLSPTVREKAVALQVETGRHLDELSPDVLDQELNFRRSLVLPISPTDSIIEAVRCALELNIPVYGVDLEEHASSECQDILIPDTVVASGRVESFVNEHASLCGSSSLTTVNQRREFAMAARLKELLASNKKVLFTCGLAHWRRLAGLIEDPEVQATTHFGERTDEQFKDSIQRVVIDQSLAFQFLERLPIIARLYQRARRHPLLDDTKPDTQAIPILEVFNSTLRHGIRNYLNRNGAGKSQHELESAPFHKLMNFPRKVMLHASLGLSEVPSVSSTLRCAQSFVSESFAIEMANLILKIPWSRAEDYKDCEPLSSSESIGNKGGSILIKKGPIFLEPTRVSGTRDVEWIGLNSTKTENSVDADAETDTEKTQGHNFTWTPWEHLITGLSDDAIHFSRKLRSLPFAEPFRGSIQRGIAFKETLLAQARGKAGLWVYGEPSSKPSGTIDLCEGWPVVWIFDDGETDDSSWSNLIVPLAWIRPFLNDIAKPELPSDIDNGYLSALICFEGGHYVLGNDDTCSRVHASTLRGLIVYGPVFSQDEQYAHWLEATNCKHNPLFVNNGPLGLPTPVTQHCESHGFPLGELRWQDDIVRMALPYGVHQVTVVLPRNYKLDAVVHREAAQLGKRVSEIRLDQFSEKDIERARSNIMVPGFSADKGPEYATDAQMNLAEERDCFAHRMPEQWKRFGLSD